MGDAAPRFSLPAAYCDPAFVACLHEAIHSLRAAALSAA